MIDFKKMDDKDFVFVNKVVSDKDDKAFSDFLRNRKTKASRTRGKKKSKVFQTR
ncbi:MAG: hypothetical protein QM764_22575 [Chitinophagaceae bacterium]